MKLSQIIKTIDGTVVNERINLDAEVKGAYSADLMSDVLASIQSDTVLITGLCNPQVVRTAQMADILALIIVRDKKLPQETIELANEEQIPVISTPYGMYEVCGRLFKSGLSSLENNRQPSANG
jgi:predicted transcriptional regulator